MKALITFCFFLICSFVNAAVIPVVNGDNLQTKITNASAGDVLMVAAGTYGSISINKQLTLIGTGYFLPGGGPGVGVSVITGTVEFTTGSDNSLMMGFQINNQVMVGASGVTFARNFINFPNNFIHISRDLTNGYKATNNIVIKQNYIKANIAFEGSTTYPCTNLTFRNNIVIGSIYFNYSSESSGIFVNNTFDADLTASGSFYIPNAGFSTNSSFYNNIFSVDLYNSSNYLLGDASRIPLNFKYNVLRGNGTPEQNAPTNNLINQDNTTFFVGYPTNPSGVPTDARNVLKPASPAVAYGKLPPYDSNAVNTDAGAFGGEEPYVLSGIPMGPYVYKISVPPVGANNSNIRIQVKAKTNN